MYSKLYIVNHYFSIITEAYEKDSDTAAQYLGYAYAEILALDSDPYQLRGRIEKIRMQPEAYGLDETVEEIKLTRSMSRKGHDALLNALSAFNKTSEKVVGANDYSALALQFFRVLEIEYCEKPLKPIAASVDIEQFKAYAEACTNERNQRGWHQDAVYIRKIIYGLLSQAGQNALNSKKMLDVIGKNPVKKYRIPGAHTGCVPYSVACEAKSYVMNSLSEVITWFN